MKNFVFHTQVLFSSLPYGIMPKAKPQNIARKEGSFFLTVK